MGFNYPINTETKIIYDYSLSFHKLSSNTFEVYLIPGNSSIITHHYLLADSEMTIVKVEAKSVPIDFNTFDLVQSDSSICKIIKTNKILVCIDSGFVELTLFKLSDSSFLKEKIFKYKVSKNIKSDYGLEEYNQI